jgi:hypothetical protein
MATVLIRLKIKPGMEQRYEEIQKDLYEKTHRLEPKVLRYEMWRGQEEGSYYCLLAFPDYLSFLIDHQISDHHEEATPPLMEVIAEESLEWVDPIQGASPLPPTEAQEPPAGAPDIASTYHQMLRVQVAHWWTALRGGAG